MLRFLIKKIKDRKRIKENRRQTASIIQSLS